MKTLLVIDMQNDFITGALGTAEAQAITAAAKAKIAAYRAVGDRIIYTRDTHTADYLNTSEGKKLPVIHCVKGTYGWEIADGLYAEGCEIIDKPTFGYLGWSSLCFDEIEMIGLCTDICIISNALILKAMFPESRITVDAGCCAGVTPDAHRAALLTMRMCQIDVIGDECYDA